MNQLANYVQGRLQAGTSKAHIKEELQAVGWSDEEADGAYRDGLVAMGIPLPTEANRPTLARPASAVDVAINFFSFILLGIVAYGLGNLFFSVIDKSFPDPMLQRSWFRDQTIHHAIASLVIAFPAYVLAMRFWFRRFQADEGRTESGLTKWLTYIVLLIASITIVGDLITVLYTLLQGEITTRFLLKAITLLVLAGLVSGFYFLERKKIQYRKAIRPGVFRNFGWIVAGLVIAGIGLGFMDAGSPEQARKQAFDLQRSTRLGTLSNCIERYAGAMGQLPVSLDDLRKSAGYAYCADAMQDPKTRADFEYRVVTASRLQGEARVGEFELCASFDLPSAVEDGDNGMYGANVLLRRHPAGRSCDTVTAQLVGRKPGATN
jgi:membrane protein YqaA with SNARE-associated domain